MIRPVRNFLLSGIAEASLGCAQDFCLCVEGDFEVDTMDRKDLDYLVCLKFEA